MSEPKYYFAVNDQQRGPVGPAELIAMRLPPGTLVWREGMSDWRRMDSVTELTQSANASSDQSTSTPVTPPPFTPPPFNPPPFSPTSAAPFATPIGYGGVPPRDDSKRIMAGIFGIVMGSLGIHKFILGYTGAGLIMLLITIFTCGWGGIVFHAIGLIEGIVYLTKSQEDFHQTYVVNRREWFYALGMSHEIVQVDAFTDKPFHGNPAAVCILNAPADAQWMQNVAMEMNLSETAFVWPVSNDLLSLRWFTPTVEVDLCGHATLAAAHVLWENGALRADQLARFETRSGVLTARRDGAWIELDFPSLPPAPVEAPPGLIESLGAHVALRVRAVGRSRFDYLVELDADQPALEKLTPDMRKLSQVDARAVIVTTRRASDDKFDFVSRFFAPRCGIDEDPVTGSAHCALAPWWANCLNKREMLAYQASKRGGIVRVKLRDDRVLLAGHAITIFRAMLHT